VAEYWIVTPWPSVVEVLSLGTDAATGCNRASFGKEDTLTSPAFPELRLKLADIFNFPLEPGEEPPAVREPPPVRYAAAQAQQ
jgi:hypothetical protein